MMEANTLPPNFWTEAIKCASYIHNRFPYKQIDGMTPFEAWSGHKPDDFNIFGSKAWARILTEKRKDLQTQSQECLFFGYSEDSKGFKLINLSTNKYFIERSVQFQDPLATLEVGESSSPLEPLIVSEETNKFDDSDMYNNYDFIADLNIPTRPKWAAKTIHAAGVGIYL